MDTIIASYKGKTVQAKLIRRSLGYKEIVVTGLHASDATVERPDTAKALDRQRELRCQISDGLIAAGADFGDVYSADYSR